MIHGIFPSQLPPLVESSKTIIRINEIIPDSFGWMKHTRESSGIYNTGQLRNQ
jgi:hypothetical protein